uniref:polynucleotide adenylyltransferase n=1 Tax=Monopterus albus TaxID=43700 RepID=A0A3Q3IFK7_MONAL
MSGGWILPYGSYCLGAHSRGSDIDAVCIGPVFVKRSDFFTSFAEKLKAQEEVKDLQVSHIRAYEWKDVFLLVKEAFIGWCLMLITSGWSATHRTSSRFYLFFSSSYFPAERNIYSNRLGFLGGVSWAILVARTCQHYPNSLAPTLVFKFFKAYSMW